MRRMKPVRRRGSQRGQVLPLVGMTILLLTAVAGATIDLGHEFVTKRQLQSAADSAALAGATTLQGTSPTIYTTTPAWDDPLVYAAHDYAAANGFATVFPTRATGSSAQYHSPACYSGGGDEPFQEMFFDSAHGTSCTNGFPTTGFTTAVQVNVPPITQPGFPAVPTQCLPGSGNPDNCVQVVVYQDVTNYIMGIFGQGSEYLVGVATGYANPGSTGVTLPGSYAVYLYEPATGCSGQCYIPAAPLSKGALNCTGLGNNCPTLWSNDLQGGGGGGGGGATIEGLDGSTLSPPAHTTPAESAGHVVNQVNPLAFCDPYGGATCLSTQAPVGTYGYALGTGANIYCSGVQSGSPSNACTNTTPPGGLENITGNQVGYASSPYTPPAVTPPSNECGGLILNGDPITASNSPPVFFNLSGMIPTPPGSGCAPSSNDPYTIQPGRYDYIVINHGQYNMAGGLYYIDDTAPVNTAVVGPTIEANGIDHSQETTGGPQLNDWDLCQQSNAGNSVAGTQVCGATPGPALTAGVWIGHGWACAPQKNDCGTAATSTGTTCASGSVVAGTTGGGGDATDITGSGVSFYFGPSSGGFVSTQEVDSISLNGPNIGALSSVGGAPILFNMQNNGWTHLDGDTAQFQGIIYQQSSATAGGVDIDPGAGTHTPAGATVTGQVYAYSMDFFGQAGTAVNFSGGWGSGGQSPTVSSGTREPGLVHIPSNALTASGSSSETLTVDYTDEWMMDAWDLSIQINSLTTYYFSQPIWSISPNTAPTSGPYPPQNGYIPSDANPRYMAYDQGSVVYPPPSPAYTQVNGALAHEYTSSTAGNTTWDISGDWAWGNQSNIPNPKSKAYAATISYTFPIPQGTQVGVLLHVVDGDNCGDYDNVSATFANVGAAGGVGLSNGGATLLVQ